MVGRDATMFDLMADPIYSCLGLGTHISFLVPIHGTVLRLKGRLLEEGR